MRVQKHLAVSLFLLFHVYANKITKSYIFFFYFFKGEPLCFPMDIFKNLPKNMRKCKYNV